MFLLYITEIRSHKGVLHKGVLISDLHDSTLATAMAMQKNNTHLQQKSDKYFNAKSRLRNVRSYSYTYALVKKTTDLEVVPNLAFTPDHYEIDESNKQD